MLSLQSVNLAVRLNPLYGTAAWHIQTCVLWMTVRGNWLSVQVQSEGRKSRGVPAAYLLLRIMLRPRVTCVSFQQLL
jgi:hypothetical protein